MKTLKNVSESTGRGQFRGFREPKDLQISKLFLLAFFLVVLSTGLVTFSQRQFETLIQSEEMTMSHYVILDGIRSLVSAALLSYVAYFTYYRQLSMRHWPQVLIRYLLMFVAYLLLFSYLSFTIYSHVINVMGLSPWVNTQCVQLIWIDVAAQLFLFTVTVATMHGVYFFQYSTFKELRLLKIEQSLTQERLQSLQTKLNPHFLFNTLNTISAMMYRDVEVADRMIERLSELLRASLKLDSVEVTIKEELELLHAYISIMSERFPDQFQIAVRCDPKLSDFFIPPFLLQPLVENFFKHSNFELRSVDHGPGEVDVSIEVDRDSLLIIISDNGLSVEEMRALGEGFNTLAKDRFSQLIDIEASAKRSVAAGAPGGLGLKVTQARLRLLYGDHATLSYGRKTHASGYQVEVKIPLELSQFGTQIQDVDPSALAPR